MFFPKIKIIDAGGDDKLTIIFVRPYKKVVCKKVVLDRPTF